MTKRNTRIALGASALVLLVLAACVGDAPATSAPSTDGDAGTDATPAPTSTGDSGSPPIVDAGPQSVVQIGLGDQHGCALISDGTVWCWGDNTLGEVGIAPPGTTALPPQQVPGLTDVASLAVGGNSTCAIKKDATIWCWGQNNYWQLGHDPNANEDAVCGASRCNPTPTQVPSIFVLQASLNSYQTCVVTTNHTVMCWGDNNDGQCGVAQSPTELPTVIPGLKNITEVRIGYFAVSACAIDTAGTTWCWGKNTYGSLGHDAGTLSDVAYSAGFYNPTPHHVLWPDGGLFDQTVDVIAGSTVCAVRADGTVWCWGKNNGNHLTLAQADSNQHPAPTKVKSISGATAIGWGNAACALTDGGVAYCWGGAGSEVAPGTSYDGGCTTPAGTSEFCQDPAPVAGPPFAAFAIEHFAAAGLTPDGGVFAWGVNGAQGRLAQPAGDGTLITGTPTQVEGLP